MLRKTPKNPMGKLGENYQHRNVSIKNLDEKKS
jgi:hypothetical protein